MKKRVERSHEDPTTVITTYEGQHNHPVPTSLRGNNAAARMFTPYMLSYSTPTPSAAAGSNFSQDLLLQIPSHHQYHNHTNPFNAQTSGTAATMYSQSQNYGNISLEQYHQLAASDYGLLQDVVPSMFLKQEP